MSMQAAIEAVQQRLVNHTPLRDIVGTNIHYARGPVDGTLPQVIFFDVTATSGYIVDYNSATMQFSCWSNDKYQAMQLADIIRLLFNRFSGNVTTYLGSVQINFTNMIDSSALPESDPNVFGYQSRFQFWMRGTNIGGI